jgi:hypothetical protein
VLTAHSWPLLALAVTGLVVALIVLPTVLALLGVVASSVVIDPAPGGFPSHRGRGLRLAVHRWRPPNGPPGAPSSGVATWTGPRLARTSRSETHRVGAGPAARALPEALVADLGGGAEPCHHRAAAAAAGRGRADLFRVAQQALANLGRHAQASKVGLTLSSTFADDPGLPGPRARGTNGAEALARVERWAPRWS